MLNWVSLKLFILLFIISSYEKMMIYDAEIAINSDAPFVIQIKLFLYYYFFHIVSILNKI